MKADITNLRQGASLTRNRKEDHFFSQTSLIDRDTGREVVTVRYYMKAGGVLMHCCVWINGAWWLRKPKYDIRGHGGGKAGGYGYHKGSAALQEALSDAGIALSEPISGRGDSASESAMYAIARAVTGKRKFFMTRANG